MIKVLTRGLSIANEQLQNLGRIISQQLLSSQAELIFLIDALDSDPCVLLRNAVGPHTVKVIFRPSVTSSGRTRRNSSMQAWLDGSLPSVDTTIGMTSFHSSIWIARIARQTHSCVRIGRGPGA